MTSVPLNLNVIKVPTSAPRFVTYDPSGAGTEGFKYTCCRIEVIKNGVNWANPLKPSGDVGVSRGSGFVMKVFGETLAIVTNEHVIHDYDIEAPGAITVTFPVTGARRIEAELIGSSPEHDIALLRIKKVKKKLPWFGTYVLQFGDHDKVSMGEPLYVLGYPLGQDSLAFTQGVVSGTQFVNNTEYLYTDAAINHGNSGGAALVRVSGEYKVVGIPTAIIEGSQNAGYVTPSSTVSRFLRNFQHQYKRRKKLPVYVPKPVLAVRVEPMNEVYMGLTQSTTPEGLFLNSIAPGSLFADALQAEDQILAVNGALVNESGQTQPEGATAPLSLVQVVNRMGFDDKIEFTIIRKGHRVTVESMYDPEADPRLVVPRYKFDGEPVALALLGELVLQDLTINLVESMGGQLPYLAKWKNLHEQCTTPAVIYSDRIGRSMAAPEPPLIVESVNNKPVTHAHEVSDIIGKTARQFHRVKFSNGSMLVIKAYELQETAEEKPIDQNETAATKPTSVSVITSQRFERSLCKHVPGTCNCVDDIGVAADQLSEFIGECLQVEEPTHVSTSRSQSRVPERVASTGEIDEVELAFLRESLPPHLLEELGYY